MPHLVSFMHRPSRIRPSARHAQPRAHVMSGTPLPKNSLPSMAQLRAFEAVARLHGIRRAADSLRLDHGVVSRHVRSLEAWSGVQLIRSASGVTALTDEGLRYYRRISAALAEINESTRELITRGQERRLRISCVPGLASQWLTSRLIAFQKLNPDLELELHPGDQCPDLARYEADVDIRYSPGEKSASSQVSGGVRRIEIARPAVVAVASPTLAASLQGLKRPVDFLNVPFLHEESEQQWQDWLLQQGVKPAGRLRGIHLWHAHLTVEAARRGHGVALANALLVGDDLASGRLVRLPEGDKSAKRVTLGAYTFAARADGWQSSGIARFRRWIIRMMRTYLEQHPGRSVQASPHRHERDEHDHRIE